MISRRRQVRMDKEQQRWSPRHRKQIEPMISRRSRVRMEKEQRHHDAESKNTINDLSSSSGQNGERTTTPRRR